MHLDWRKNVNNNVLSKDLWTFVDCLESRKTCELASVENVKNIQNAVNKGEWKGLWMKAIEVQWRSRVFIFYSLVSPIDLRSSSKKSITYVVSLSLRRCYKNVIIFLS